MVRIKGSLFVSKFRRERLRELEYNLRWYEAENRRIMDLFKFPEINEKVFFRQYRVGT